MTNKTLTPLNFQSATELAISSDILFENPSPEIPVNSILSALIDTNPTISDMVPTALTLALRLAQRVDQINSGTPETRRASLDTLVAAIFTRVWNTDQEDIPAISSMLASVIMTPTRWSSGPGADPVKDISNVVKFVLAISSMLASMCHDGAPGDPIRRASGF